MDGTRIGTSSVKISLASASSAGLAALCAIQLAALPDTASAQQMRRPAAPAAAPAAQPSWYIGAGVGTARIPEAFESGNFDDGRSATSASNTLEHKQAHTLGRGFIGFNINRYVAIEAGYVDLGRFGGERRYVNPDGSLSVLWTVRGATLDLVGKYPVTEALWLLGRVGGAHLKSSFAVDQDGSRIYNHASSKWAFHMGVGLQYDVTARFAIRGEYELYKKATNGNTIQWADSRELQYQSISASGLVKF